ncbi:DUF3488 and transglutaminase-like domain-containing protein [Nonomuraea sp. NPDC050310]|uniref:transglutaminase family protein n=1 Tax=unclassified Nonomuraea TaxID=2593643 RepID=UPI0033FA8188
MRLSAASAVATFAAAIVLYPLLDGGAWFWASLGAVAVVFGASALAGKLALPAWAAPILSVMASAFYFTAAFSGSKAWGLLVPTKESLLHLGKLYATGWADIQRFAAPVPADAPVALLVATGVAVIAIVVDHLAARLRHAALAGLPLLALVCVPMTILPDPINWPTFILAALGFTSLLIADGRERIGHWGRAVLVRRTRHATTGPRDAVDTGGLRLSGKRIGFAAIGLAVLAPALLPVMEPVSWFTFGVGGSGKGGTGSSISIPDPVAGLKGQLQLPDKRTVLTYRNSDNQARYLRIYSLNLFNGEQFTLEQPNGRPENRVDNGPLPPPPGLSGSTPVKKVSTTITISEEVKRLNFLPLPYPATEVRADGDWRADTDSLMVFSTEEEASGMEYEVASVDPQLDPAILNASRPVEASDQNRRFLELPEGFPDSITTLATGLVSENDTPYQAAVKIQDYFKGNDFTYSLQTQGQSNEALVDFLIHSKTGYCEQYAAAMAVLARVVGIPARVAIGYTGGTKTDNGFAVSTADMHAWPELYFEGVGWLAFEPTPTSASPYGQGTARVPTYSLPQPERSDTPASPSASGESASDLPPGIGPRRGLRELEALEELNALNRLPADDSMPLAAKIGLGALGLVLLLLIPAAIRLVTRSRRARTLSWKVTGPLDDVTARAARVSVPVAAAWAELDDVLCDYGLSRELSETPRALARRLIERYEFDAESAAAVTTIATAVERVLFARDPGTAEPLGKQLKIVRRALAQTVSRGRRLRAVLLPPSTMRRIRGMGERVLDGFDRLENIRFRRPGDRTAREKELVSK